MGSALQDAKKKTSVTTRTSIEETKKQEVPKGATIISSDITTETEQIENGWLVTKRYEIRYRMKESDSNDYAYYTKKWYSEEDPLTINVTDKSLAEAFES